MCAPCLHCGGCGRDKDAPKTFRCPNCGCRNRVGTKMCIKCHKELPAVEPDLPVSGQRNTEQIKSALPGKNNES